jgi:hypothetical protein
VEEVSREGVRQVGTIDCGEVRDLAGQLLGAH